MTRLSDLTRTFARIGALSFGGPAAQIALMHRVLVEERAWLTEAQFLRALSFCMMLPGPEAMQLCTWCGWRLRGTLGGLIAGLLFVAPGALVIAALAALYLAYGALPVVQTLFLGVQATVLVIVAKAIITLSRKALKSRLDIALAIAAFIALAAFGLPFPLVIAAAALIGAATQTGPAPTEHSHTPIRWRQTLRLPAILLAAWAAPLIALAALGQDFLLQLGLFFSKLAVVTFGGAYAVLAYLTQDAVQNYGWLTTQQMIDALGLAETTPGPLILVTQFTAHLAGAPQSLALGAGLLALWVTFVPCFLWVFTAAPLIDRLESAPRLAAGLHAITCAVVGVIANLSLWFAIHVLFDAQTMLNLGPIHMTLPTLTTLSWPALALTSLAALLNLRLPLLPCLALTAGAALLIPPFLGA